MDVGGGGAAVAAISFIGVGGVGGWEEDDWEDALLSCHRRSYTVDTYNLLPPPTL